MDLLEIRASDWHINQKSIPPPDSEEYVGYYEYQRGLCMNGCTIDGVFINPYLYWHLNFWHTDIDYEENGRLLQKYAHPLLRDNEWKIFNGIWQAEKERKGLAIGGSRRISKDLLNCSKLYTLDGEIEIGDAKVGQKIFDDQGNLTTITGVFPQGIRPVYKMTLRDGRELYCGLDHNWSVIESAYKKIPGTRRNKPYYREVVKTTKQLIDSGIQKERVHNGYKDGKTRTIKEAKYWIRNNKAVKYEEKDLPIDPYFFGIWLGDGSSSTTAITTEDQEISDYIKMYADSLGLSVREQRMEGNKASTYYISSGYRGGITDKNPLKNKLRELNVLNNKHIPDIYLHSSIEQRMELLRGLMDSDGSCSANSTIVFTSSIPKLAKDFYFLVRSLGIATTKKIRPSYYVKDGVRIECKDSYEFSLYTELPVFKLKRKLCRVQKGKKGFQSKINKTAIVDIQYVFDAHTTCISVDNDQKLFLTDDFTISHNTTFESSYIAHGATFDENSQNIIAGLNSDDIRLITDKVDKGLNRIPEPFQWMRIEDNWKNQVTLGVKDTKNRKYPFSQILIRNLDGGNNEEAAAGTKPRKFIIDEGGKGSFLKALQAAIPGFTTAYGWTCSPIVTFTGGDMDKFHDAKELMFNPEAYNFLWFEHDTKPTVKHGLYLGQKYRLEGKEDSTLAEFIGKPESEELQKIPMMVSNEEKARLVTESDIEKRRLSGDRKAYLKERMYYPETVDDIFLNTATSMYNTAAIKGQLQRLEDLKIVGQAVDLFYGDNGIEWKPSTKNIITEYPLRNQNPDAAICIWEHPIPNAPKFLYVAGCLLPGEKVYTEDGLKDIDKVTLNNKLINKEGEFVNIINIQKRYKDNENVYKIHVGNTFRTTTFTKEHPIYATTPTYKPNGRTKDFKSNYDFKRAENLKVGDWIKTPNIYLKENDFDIDELWDSSHYRVDRIIQSPLKSPDFWWFTGIFLGDGYCVGDKVYASFNIEERRHIDRYKKIVSHLFGRSPSEKVRNNCVEVGFNSKQLSKFLFDNFGKYADGKFISDWAKRINTECKHQLILGYLDSDGSVCQHTKGYWGLEFVSINLTLLEDIQDILFSLGYAANLSKLRDRGTHHFGDIESKTQETYHLRLGHNSTVDFQNRIKRGTSIKIDKINNPIKTNVKNFKGCYISDDLKYIYFKIKKIDVFKYTGAVYNFECETNTFMCHHIATHNCDPYRFSQAENSDSLGAVYIYKRIHSISGEGFQDMFVASYVARPEDKSDWEENVRMLLKYYNAYALCENDEMSFIEFMKGKKEAEIYLAPQPKFQESLVQKTKLDRKFGVSRTSSKVRTFLNGLYKDYLDEVIDRELDDEGSVVREKIGVTRIFDRALLEESAQYDGVINADRCVAVQLALALANELDPLIGSAQSQRTDPRFKALFGQNKKTHQPKTFKNRSSFRRPNRLFR